MDREVALKRGVELLLTLELEPENVQELSFDVSRFRNAAAAKSWARNHGMPPVGTPKQLATEIVAEVRRASDFVPGTLRREQIAKGVHALVGELVTPEVPEVGQVVERRAGDAQGAEAREVDFAKRGDLFAKLLDDAEEENPTVRMVGIVMMPEIPDAEGDVTSADEIESANLRFMTEFQTVGFMHAKDVSDRVKIIQNVIAPVDFDYPLPDGTSKRISKGTWYQELFSDDEEIVSRVREGKLTGLSIGGRAKRVPVSSEEGQHE